jgi:hypothetical protein
MNAFQLYLLPCRPYITQFLIAWISQRSRRPKS